MTKKISNQEVQKEKVTVDLSPVNNFHYCQISNHDFNYLIADADYRALHTPTPCKDYLQDIFFTEYTGETSDVYGLKWNKGMLDMSQEYFNLVIMGGKYEMESKIPQIEAILQTLDKAQGIPLTQVLPTTNPKHILIKFHRDWTRNGPTLSAYTSMVRISAYYQGEDPMEFLEKMMSYNGDDKPEDLPVYMQVEIRRLPKTIKKFAALYEGEKAECPWENFKGLGSTTSIHDMGIVNFQEFPTKSL